MRQKIVQLVVGNLEESFGDNVLGLDELGGVWLLFDGRWVEHVSAIADKIPASGKPGDITLTDDYTRKMSARLIEVENESEIKGLEIDRLNKIIYGSDEA